MMKGNQTTIILGVLFILLATNGIFYIMVEDISLSIMNSCIVFCNIAIVAQLTRLLPIVSRSEKNMQGAATMVSVVYLVAQFVAAICCINMVDMNPTTAFMIQLIILSIYLISLLRVIVMNKRSSMSLRQQEMSRSIVYQMALNQLKDTLSITDNREQRTILHEAIATLSSIPQNVGIETERIDNAILECSNSLCGNICRAQMIELRNLAMTRRNLVINRI